MPEARQKPLFPRFARAASQGAGRPGVFLVAVVLILAWAVTGPLFHWSDTWQLVINTGTTVITFLMVFLIQHTQNRDSEAVQLKLDEVIRAIRGARNEMVNLEDLGDEELRHVRDDFSRLADEARQRREHAESGAADGVYGSSQGGGREPG